MQRFLSALLIIPIVAFLAGVAGCGKEDKTAQRPGKKLAPDGDSGGQAGASKKTVIKPGTAKLVGRVTYDGDPPAGSLEETMKGHKDHPVCLAGPENEKIEQTWIVDKDKGVENVVIWVNPPSGSEFEPGQAKEDAVLDQPHCVYVPHVLVVLPGQKLLIKNSAPVLHNTKLDVDGFVNKGFGQSIEPRQSASHELKPQDRVITATCDIHGWMKAKIWALPHQYAAVTKADGSYVIENLPEGEFSVVAWHEGANFFHGDGKKGKKETIKGETRLDLKVKAQ